MKKLIVLVSVLTACGGYSSGDNGANGSNGTQGPQGVQGPVGPIGQQGVKGADGKNGADANQDYTDGSRLKLKTYPAWTGADGSKYAPSGYGFHDSQLDIDCSLMKGSDGNSYCLPATSYSTAYSDSSCLTAIAYFPSACGAAIPKYFTIVSQNGGSCSETTYSTYQPGSEFTGANTYAKIGTSCYSETKSTSFRYVYLTSVPYSTFVKFTKQ